MIFSGEIRRENMATVTDFFKFRRAVNYLSCFWEPDESFLGELQNRYAKCFSKILNELGIPEDGTIDMDLYKGDNLGKESESLFRDMRHWVSVQHPMFKE